MARLRRRWLLRLSPEGTRQHATGSARHHWGGEPIPRNFCILLEGKLLVRQMLGRNRPGEFFDVETPLPPDLLAGKREITVRFEPETHSVAGGIFHCAVMKASAH